MQDIIIREMSITHDEFFRLLPRALKNRRYEILNNLVRVALDPGYLTISLSPQITKQLGSLALPVTQVSFDVTNCRGVVRLKFIADFDLAYQKGGG